jgi:2-polyprenyl-3-methyl-5-hydroxy-6-metoxy-1,4-benzoquinol methylase
LIDKNRESEEEFNRLRQLGWKVPPLSSVGLYSPIGVDESRISFPSESYDSKEANTEARGFWALERANSIASILNEATVKTLWEIGAGNGNAAIPLRDHGFNVIPIEPLKSGASTLAKNGFQTFHSTLEDLLLPENSIEAFGAFDVLEHLEKPEVLLTEIYRVLKPGGIFICSVPAYQWLFSDFDLSIGHYRRYSRRSITSLIGSMNIEVVKVKSIYAFLIIPAFLLRRIPFLLGRRASLTKITKSRGGNSRLVNKLDFALGKIHKVEQLLNLPFGLTLIVSAKKL